MNDKRPLEGVNINDKVASKGFGLISFLYRIPFNILSSLFNILDNFLTTDETRYKRKIKNPKDDKPKKDSTKDSKSKDTSKDELYNYDHDLGNGYKYSGLTTNGQIFVKDDKKEKKENDKNVLVVRSTQMNSEYSQKKREEYMKYENNKYNGGKKIDTMVAEKTNDIINHLNKLDSVQNSNNEKAKTFKLVFDQHGAANGLDNDLQITKHEALSILKALHEKGYTKLTISDRACHGSTGRHFKEARKELNVEMEVQLRYASKKNIAVDCLKGKPSSRENSRVTLQTLSKSGTLSSRKYIKAPSFSRTQPSNPARAM